MLSLDRQNHMREQYRVQHPEWRPATEHFAALVRSHLTPNSRVLDLGCGRGGLVEQLAHPLTKVVGVDPDIESLQTHRLNLQRAAAFQQLPFAAGSFDVVYASWVLEHWAQPLIDLREIGRILTPSGHFIFITPNKLAPLIQLNHLIGSIESVQKRLVSTLYARDETDTFAVTYRANDVQTLSSLAARCGLALSSVQLVPDPTYLAFNMPLFRITSHLETYIPATHKLHLVGEMRKSAEKP